MSDHPVKITYLGLEIVKKGLEKCEKVVAIISAKDALQSHR